MQAWKLLTTIGVLALLGCTAIGGIAWYFTSKYKVPISMALPILTTFLPSVDFLSTYQSIVRLPSAAKKRNNRPLSVPFLLVNLLLLLAPAAILTYSTTFTGGQQCDLRKQWQAWYSAHDANAINSIQDNYQCCGFSNTNEMPFPFPKTPKKHEKDGVVVPPQACANALESKLKRKATPCYPEWQETTKTVGSMLVGANSVMLAMKLFFLIFILGSPDLVSSTFYNLKKDGYASARIQEVEDDDEGQQSSVPRNRPQGRVLNGHHHGDANGESSPLLSGLRAQPDINVTAEHANEGRWGESS